MQVTKIDVSTRSGANGRPNSGYAMFDDGRYFSFGPRMDRVDGAYREVGFRFYSSRKRAHGGHEHYGFASPAREAALTAYLDTI